MHVHYTYYNGATIYAATMTPIIVMFVCIYLHVSIYVHTPKTNWSHLLSELLSHVKILWHLQLSHTLPVAAAVCRSCSRSPSSSSSSFRRESRALTPLLRESSLGPHAGGASPPRGDAPRPADSVTGWECVIYCNIVMVNA